MHSSNIVLFPVHRTRAQRIARLANDLTVEIERLRFYEAIGVQKMVVLSAWKRGAQIDPFLELRR